MPQIDTGARTPPEPTPARMQARVGEEAPASDRGSSPRGNSLPVPYYDSGGIVIYCGDCRGILPLLADDPVDRVLTDPPYGVLAETWDDMTRREFAAFCMSWLGPIASRRWPLVTFAADRTRSTFVPLLEAVYESVRQLVWDKQAAHVASDGFWYSFEAIYACGDHDTWEVAEPKSLAVADKIRAAREAKRMSRGAVDMAVRGKKTGLCYRWEEGACLPTPEQTEVLRGLLDLDGAFDDELAQACARRDTVKHLAREAAPKARKRDVFRYQPITGSAHPTEKPVVLLRELMMAFPDDRLILDPFAGSGTTLRAAKDLGRRAIGVEISEKYCSIAARRLGQEVLSFGATP